MSVFALLRTLFFIFFVLVNAGLLSAAALNLVSSSRPGALRSVDMYLIFSSAATIVFLFPIVLVDLLRRGALTSKVWFECVWLFVAWVINLCGASAVTALSPTSCASTTPLSCSSSRVLMGVTWTATLLVLAQFGVLLVSAIYYSKRFPDVWTTSVRDFQWWAGGGEGKMSQLGSRPPSPAFVPRELTLGAHTNPNPYNAVPHLERMAANWQPSPPKAPRTQSVTVQAMTVVPASQPQPLTLAYAPEPAPTRQPMHYNASAVFSVGVLPERNPSKKAPSSFQAQQMSFYPQTVQVAINATPSRAPTAPAPAQEPLPIRDWPRVNPHQPFTKHKGPAGASAAPVVASRHVYAHAPQPSVASTASSAESTGRRRSGPRPRPPPLDLSKARPNRLQ